MALQNGHAEEQAEAAVVLKARKRRRGSGYLPGLDGWRALAILGVIMTHDAPWTIGSWTNAAWKGNGGDGVQLFFAISGLLICWRILEEETLVGSFHLKRFYIRRFFRIQPAALVYLSAVLVLKLAGGIHELWRFWFGALFLYQNFLFHSQSPHLILYGLFTGHFWTLAVEEHFYLILSLLLFFVRRRRIAVFLGLLLLLVVGQQVATHLGRFSVDVSPRRTYWIMQWLLWPSIVAMVVRIAPVRRWCTDWLRPWVAFVGTALLVVAHGFLRAHTTQWSYTREHTLLLLLAPLWLTATMLHGQSWTTRFLETPPMRWVGRLSYSLYLWHVLFFHLTSAQVSWGWMHVLGRRPWMYLLSLGFASASYYLVEKPMMRLGHKMAPPATGGRKDMQDLPDEPTDVEAVTEELAVARAEWAGR